MTITAARLAAWAAALASRSAMSMLPWASQATATTRMPAITALAGLVPWALVGIRHTWRWPSPRLRCQARITIRPAYSPWEPAFGCRDTPAKPVIAPSQASRSAARSA